MLYSTLFLALFSASLSAAAPSKHDHVHSLRGHKAMRDARHSLTLQLKTPGDMNDADNLTLNATVINTGSKAVKLLNDPNSASAPSLILGSQHLT